jgi:F-type H+-transporting ATPase subunit epsilon|tara:strand:- start:480 stop:872 length:393 start_codon:yes stop_codon:yes gene_type:complete
MPDTFKLEIISPDQNIMKSEASEVTIPAFEGLMTILKDHISLITFLRPGFIDVKTLNSTERFFVEEGTIEFFDNSLLILSSTTINLKNLSGDLVAKMIKETKEKMKTSKIDDKNQYILNYKIESLQEINQ